VKHLFINALVFVLVNMFSQESQPGLLDKTETGAIGGCSKLPDDAILNAQPRRVGNEKKL
jgi:hypothetical protein